MGIDIYFIFAIILDTAVNNIAKHKRGPQRVLFYRFETMRYEIVGDKRPDLLAEKLDTESEYGSDEPAEDDD